MIHVDTREKPPIPQQLELRLPVGDYSRHTLRAGDFAIFDADGHALGIEHKRPLDFLASLGDKQANKEKRIWNQIEKMREWYTHQLILVSGPLSYDPTLGTLGTPRHMTAWNARAVRLLEWTVARECPIMHLASVDEMLDLLVYLNKRSKSGCVVPGNGIIHRGDSLQN